MKKKNVLLMLATLTVASMISACGAKEEEAAVEEKDTVVEAASTEAELPSEVQTLIEDIVSDVALADDVATTEAQTTEEVVSEEDEVLAYNASRLGSHISFSDQAKEVAEALAKLGFGKLDETENYYDYGMLINDDKGMVLDLVICDRSDGSYRGCFIKMIRDENKENVLWEWEYTDKYEKEERAIIEAAVEAKKQEEQN